MGFGFISNPGSIIYNSGDLGPLYDMVSSMVNWRATPHRVVTWISRMRTPKLYQTNPGHSVNLIPFHPKMNVLCKNASKAIQSTGLINKWLQLIISKKHNFNLKRSFDILTILFQSSDQKVIPNLKQTVNRSKGQYITLKRNKCLKSMFLNHS